VAEDIRTGNDPIEKYFECCFKVAKRKFLDRISDKEIFRKTPGGKWRLNITRYEKKYGKPYA